jgi:EAL domain-containing protein (putative c-di-GMP-specific phosphodiesterase class I)
VGALAQSLGIRLTAEGIEVEEQVAFLRLLGFSEGQGYLFGKPMRDVEFRQRLHPGADEAWARQAT